MEIVLDIETVGQGVEDVPERALEYLYRSLQRDQPDPEELERRREDLVSRFGLDPTTGRVVCVGTFDVETSRERAFVEASERALLESFWQWLSDTRPKLLVTFNGKRFDVPYLEIRSAIHGIEPESSFSSIAHIDLRQTLEGDERRRRGSLDYFCAIFGIPSPKTELDGSRVEEAFGQGRIEEITRYCLEDCRATAALYKRLRPFCR
ncbi:MAG TPA: ribonuclease H-like domain-containing protein [Vicinamibacteria bacterium]|nr:ribonuclease H-like domain-containing protein [Vicinamibacteria bacterium]